MKLSHHSQCDIMFTCYVYLLHKLSVYNPNKCAHTIPERMVYYMSKNNFSNVYDDDNIPEVDLPKDDTNSTNKPNYNVEPLPESSRPRKDGPGGA